MLFSFLWELLLAVITIFQSCGFIVAMLCALLTDNLRYNSHTINIAHLNYNIKSRLVFQQIYTTVTTILLFFLAVSLFKNYFLIIIFIYLFIFHIYSFLKDRENRVWAEEGQRERETESKPSSMLWAVSTEPEVGSK